MSLLIPLLVIGAVILAGLAVLSSSQGTASKPSAPTQPTADKETHTAQTYTYSCQKSLFTRAELSFYRALQEATTDRYHVFGKVRVADVLKPQTENRGDWQRAFNKISAKHFDFVLCDRDRLSVLAAIELDDNSHQRVDRVKRDDFLNQAVKSAGLPLIRFPVQTAYNREAIQHHIAQTLGPHQPEQSQPAPNQTAQPLGQLQPKQAQATPKPKPKPKPRPAQP
ncbi:DUF2726 domain-containing protein [Nodosilinea sp. LEGE 07298]|uniref:DUF2726 domain-containing protein n=1 Tax=Nodosilinea sp. LEGE 07298 TaxID=2777970 RepID=UPI00187FE751|nr:DUF2726 domain-containing protein [Nodosilinea sp. LEGE 07298]MBE9112351.1 DUF2726 domain-containing protein [Nodosilinea sp. LEGE 07298]